MHVQKIDHFSVFNLMEFWLRYMHFKTIQWSRVRSSVTCAARLPNTLISIYFKFLSDYSLLYFKLDFFTIVKYRSIRYLYRLSGSNSLYNRYTGTNLVLEIYKAESKIIILIDSDISVGDRFISLLSKYLKYNLSFNLIRI